ncbi:MAG TPA: penicillin acylase family protein [Pirellulales bacterium]|jgi:acyl-homoserine-lactone acylase|nr:penicillin acylase family protein [Pirellulales bacterium]
MPRSLARHAGCMVSIGLVCSIALLGRPGLAQTNQPSAAATAMSQEEQAKAAQLAKASSIYRDAWGVPHIRGQDDAAVLFAYAYAQAEDNFWQLEDTYILSLGRYSEVSGYYGLNSDLLNRAFEVVPQSKIAFEHLEPRMQAMCEAFTLGLNYFLAMHPETKPRLITHFEPWQVIAYGRQVLLELTFRYTRLSHNFLPRSNDVIWSSAGSNGWAVAPSRTRDKHAMLFVNPHLPWFGFSQMHEAHLVSDEGWSFYGATMFGSCVPTLGHNEHLGWTFTTNEPDVADVWRVTFDDPAHPLRYRYDNGYREAEEWTETIRVKTGNKVVDRAVKLRKTHHGPIVVREDEQHFLAARVSGIECALMRQQLALVRAKNLVEFREGLEQQQFAIMNVIYADRDGNIMFLYNGLVPQRDPQFKWNLPVDGADPRTAWQGNHKLEEMPQIINPADGYVQNCNSSPFTTCDLGNCDPKNYPTYMVEDSDQDKRRAKVSRQLLRELKSATFEDMQKLAFDTTVYWAQEELPKYARRFEALRASDPRLATEVEPYLKHLLEWNCHVSADSTAATLCEAWYHELYGMDYPAETLFPRFVGDPKLEFQALIDAAAKLKNLHGDWRVPWATLYRIQRRPNMVDLHELSFDDKQPSLPCLGAPGPLGIVFTQYYSPTIKIPFVMSIQKRYGLVGASYVAVYEFGPKVRGASTLNYGESGDPRSPHYFDQAHLLSERKLKPELFEWQDVLAGAKTAYHPGEPPVEQVAK